MILAQLVNYKLKIVQSVKQNHIIQWRLHLNVFYNAQKIIIWI